MVCKSPEHLRCPQSTTKGNSPVLPCDGLKENYEACVSIHTAWEFLSLGSYRAGTQVFLCHQNTQKTKCTAHLVIKDPCSNEQNAALQLQKQRILPVCTEAKSAELPLLLEPVKKKKKALF